MAGRCFIWLAFPNRASKSAILDVIMPKRHIVTFGKAVRTVSRLRGGGSALPGLLVEKLDPRFLKDIFTRLPYGVAIISGTNGKTTTTKMVVEMLRAQGLRVFTNQSGSNFKRGVISSLLGEIDSRGQLNADIAILELDEAHAVHFVREVAPNYCLLLNVMRDQLDRFGEIDATAAMLGQIAKRTTKGVVLNRDDPRLSSLASDDSIKAPLRSFGINPNLKKLFPSDDDLYGEPKPSSAVLYADDVSLESVDGQKAVISYDGKDIKLTLKISGVYNILNAAAAVALTRLIVGQKLNQPALTEALENVAPAFGRGEKFIVASQPLELVLVKNPSGFRLGLSSFNPSRTETMIAINDNYADGRDMSWLWDVDFISLRAGGVNMVSGIRAYDMALRLQYDDVKIEHVETNLARALRLFLASSQNSKRIFCTYTAMLRLRRELRKYAKVERAL